MVFLACLPPRLPALPACHPRRCVEEFDHCCPAVNNCVGVGNRRSFVGYMLTLWLAEVLWLSLAAAYWRR